ncbi:hypothetical protein [Nocardioides pantholopis]|uniref:hypothetical protein n=1 Tax=Nocardioides pantholopis TaxID=2483798 RepID=UPI000FDA6746|nr:hypothetical protein [Nocardioides pantholopis]
MTSRRKNLLVALLALLLLPVLVASLGGVIGPVELGLYLVLLLAWLALFATWGGRSRTARPQPGP